MLERLKNWYTLSKQYFFTYKDGFFNLSFLSNSPDLIVKSSLRMPFMKHNKEQQKLIIDTPFVKGHCFYAELEKGLWVLNSEMLYKNNVSLTPIYDDFLASNYYCLTINFVENEYTSEFFESNNIKVNNKSITFIKPKSDYLHCHFKGSTTKQHIVYFDKKWTKKNILDNSEINKEVLNLFKDSENNLINYKYNSHYFDTLVHNINKTFANSSTPFFLELKKQTYSLIDLYFSNFNKNDAFKLKKLKLKDSVKISKVEHYLMSNIYNKFPGIYAISQEFKISPTKLKNDFKDTYNKSIFNYFQFKQMDLAAQHIKNNLLVKDVARKFNYENSSKFSKTFEKYQGVLPSEFNK